MGNPPPQGKKPPMAAARGKGNILQMLRKVILLFLVALAPATPGVLAQDAPNPQPPKGERHEFVIASFRTESGVTLPQARVVYGTYGTLNAAKDNVVLLPSHYMADFHGYEWLIHRFHSRSGCQQLDPADADLGEA